MQIAKSQLAIVKYTKLANTKFYSRKLKIRSPDRNDTPPPLQTCKEPCLNTDNRQMPPCISSSYNYHGWMLRSVGEPGTNGAKPRPPNIGRMTASSNLRQ